MNIRPRDTRDTVITLVRDPRAAYRFPTDLLERTIAVLRTSYGGAEPTPAHAVMAAAEYQISATLRARLQLDRQPAQAPAQAAPCSAPGQDGGKPVPRPVQPFTQPPGGAYAVPDQAATRPSPPPTFTRPSPTATRPAALADLF